MLQSLKALPKFIQHQQTHPVPIPNTCSLCLLLPQEERILCCKSIFCKHASWRGNGSQELALGACECSHTLLTALTGVLACLAGRWQGLTALLLVKQFKKQIFKPVPAADPTSFAYYPAEQEISAACRESSLFTEEICRCAHPRSINGPLWEYRDNWFLIKC